MKLIFKLLLCSKHMALLLLVVLSIAKYSDALKLAKPGCQEKCGAVDIPYPFGIGPNCSLHEGFEVICSMHGGIMVPFHGNMEVISIMLTKAHTRVYNHASSSQCYQKSTGVITSFSNKTQPLNLKSTVYTLSKHHNEFVVFGCETLAFNEMQDNKNNRYRIGCVSTSCHNQKRFEKDTCYGNGCCHTPIPYGIKSYNISFPFGFNSQFWNYSHCNYAVVMEKHNYAHAIDLWSQSVRNAAVPVVLNWFIGNETCEVAQTNRSNYACVSTNSLCINAPNDSGYTCNCSHGYDGNPYLLDGCQDINECKHHSICSGMCFNKEGSYICISRAILLTVGVSTVILLLLFFLFCMQKAYGRRRIAQIRERYFQQNGGQLLLDEMKNNHGIAFTIFTEEELKEATNSFDKTNMLGQGGNGTVFKGKLRTNEEVAIKKCKTITERNKTEFGKEMLILSQINHKNIVRILGCCLELEIPILVYEFIPNGTLFQLLHLNDTLHIPLKTRLRIAEEAGDALAYLHSWASPPIVHCDVKSANILLDENYAAKVSDFGASALAPSDEDQFITLVQGTRGYLDPQSIQTGQLTVKSDVYSFGVVLVELLTRRKAFFLEGPEERSLASAFLTAMKENRLEDLLDVQILEEGNMNLIKGVAELATECLNMNGEMRPEMREVAEQLNKLRKAIEQ